MTKILAESEMRVPANTDSPEMTRFNDALRQILQVPKAELNRLLAEEKASKKGKTKPGPKPKNT
jgi:hypothetical protein